jgi:hypothetical protein
MPFLTVALRNRTVNIKMQKTTIERSAKQYNCRCKKEVTDLFIEYFQQFLES